MSSDSDVPLDAPMQSRTRLPIFALSTLALALALIGTGYQLRPMVEARAVIEVGDGDLSQIIPTMMPGFAYTPPAAIDATGWLNRDTTAADQTLMAEGHRLTIQVRDQDPDLAAARAERIAEQSIAFMADHRPNLLRDIKAWFNDEIDGLEALSEAVETGDDQRLFDFFQTALVKAKAEARAERALLLAEGQQLDATFIRDKIGDDPTRRDVAYGRIVPWKDAEAASLTYEHLAEELQRLRAGSSQEGIEFATFRNQRSDLVERQSRVLASDAWSQPVAKLAGSIVTTEPPYWAMLPFLVPAAFVLALLLTSISPWVLRLFSRRDVEDDTLAMEPKPLQDEQMLDDPDWPSGNLIRPSLLSKDHFAAANAATLADQGVLRKALGFSARPRRARL